MLNRIQLKREAKQIVRSARSSAYVMALIYLSISAFLNIARLYTEGSDQVAVTIGGYTFQTCRFSLFTHAPFPRPVVLFVGILVWLLLSVLRAGWVLYHQSVRQGKQTAYSVLFDGFAFTGKIILLNLVLWIFIFLWTLLLIIPGIIAAYRYRFALYNLCENPDIGIMEAISMSKQQTMGRKLDLFVLDLTFIGWSLLCGLTCGILTIWIAPYIQQTDIGYFETLKQETGVGVLHASENE